MDRGDRVQIAKRRDRLSAEGDLPADARRLRQSVHRAHPADARVHRQSAAGDHLVRQARAPARHGDRRTVEGGAALRQFAGHRLRLDVPCGLARYARGLCLLALPHSLGRRSSVLHPVDPNDAAGRGRHSDLSDVPAAQSYRHQDRDDPALYGGQRFARGLAAEGLHRRDPARIRRGRPGRRLHALAGAAQGRAAASGDRHRRHRDLLPDLLLERICLCGPADQRRRADHAAVHSVHHRGGRPGLAGGCGGDDAVRDSDRVCSPSCCASICCAASPSERCANERRGDRQQQSLRSLVPPRAVGSRGHDADRRAAS